MWRSAVTNAAATYAGISITAPILIHRHARKVPLLKCEEPQLPQQADTVVIGGGVAGLSTALHLSQAFKKVVLLERQSCGSGATGLSCATLQVVGDGDGTDSVAELTAETSRVLRKLEADGHHCGYVTCGSLELARHGPELEWAQETTAGHIHHGYDVRLLSAADAQRLEPALQRSQFAAAIYAPQAAYVDPGVAAASLAEAACNAGALLVENCAVLGAEQTGLKRWKVQSSKGTVECNHVILCTGAWAAEVGKTIGLDVPVKKVKAQMWVAEAAARGESSDNDAQPVLSHVIYCAESHSFWHSERQQEIHPDAPLRGLTHTSSGKRQCHHVYGRPAPEGAAVWFGGDRLPLLNGNDDFEPDPTSVAENFEHICSLLPALDLKPNSYQAWAGVIGPTIQNRPLIGEVLFCPGLWLCTGFGGSGYMQGVGAGAAVAAWIQSSEEPMPKLNTVREFRATRVAADPSPLVFPTHITTPEA